MLEKKIPKRHQISIYLDDDDAKVIGEIMKDYGLNMNQAVRTCVKHAIEMYNADNNVNDDLSLPARIFAGAKKAVYKADLKKRGYYR